jgi:hypothetical protein
LIKAYLAEYQTISDYIPKTKKVLGMLLKKYDAFPIMKRYIHLMDSMVSLSQIWTDKSVVLGGADVVCGAFWDMDWLFGSAEPIPAEAACGQYADYLNDPKNANIVEVIRDEPFRKRKARVKRFKTFMEIAIPALLGLSGVIFALAK